MSWIYEWGQVCFRPGWLWYHWIHKRAEITISVDSLSDWAGLRFQQFTSRGQILSTHRLEAVWLRICLTNVKFDVTVVFAHIYSEKNAWHMMSIFGHCATFKQALNCRSLLQMIIPCLNRFYPTNWTSRGRGCIQTLWMWKLKLNSHT